MCVCVSVCMTVCVCVCVVCVRAHTHTVKLCLYNVCAVWMYLCIVRACSEDFRCVDLPECNNSLRVTLDKTSLTADTAFFHGKIH